MGHNKYSALAARLRLVIAHLEEVEEEIRGIEAMWGGPPTVANIARYEHDPVMWNTVVRARNRYGHLMEEREMLREVAYAIQRKLEEVAG